MKIDRLRARLDDIQQARPWLAFPYAVIKKFGADSSTNLAVLITYYTFFSVFPLLLAMFSILGFVLHGNPHLQHRIETSTLHELPLVSGPVPKHGSVAVVVVGVVLALYSGLGVAKAAQNAWDTVYCVPQTDRPNWLQKNVRSLRLVAVGGTGLVATAVVSTSVASGGAIGLHVGFALTILGIAVTLVLNTALLAIVFRWLTSREVSFREVIAGAAFAAVAFEVLQAIASAFIAHKLKGAKATYGAFGTVVVLLSWFYLQSVVLLLAAQVNVVKQDRLWPRSMRAGSTEPRRDGPEETGSSERSA
ncbi:MAG TPA: YihY/virulence factor BrkB family protein [Mycobacteriales bacterium]|nr:YihY/virulence factor BrkB family protein [Mycobacteriales bacterium]